MTRVAVILCTLWLINEARNRRECEHNTHTGKGYPS